ncbi:MAG: hypothetical protein E7241_08925 [Lachnospiraceae bacterium]|jgi:cell division protein FtsL|nr:hypothetical protein [Lachnospiraceae bacterium]
MARRNTDEIRRKVRAEYIYGNTVREIEPYSIPRQRDKERREKQRRKEVVSRNRQRQMAIDAGFMLFLTIAVAATMLICINFLRLKAQVQTETNKVAAVKEEIVDLKAKNDAAYNKIITSVNLDTIREKALGYGMVPAKKDQIEYYKSNEDDYMTIYKAVTK